MMRKPARPEPFWLTSLFVVVGCWLTASMALTGAKDWYAFTLLGGLIVCYPFALRAELRGRTRLAWGLGLLFVVIPLIVGVLRLAFIVVSTWAG
jgi:hypothetical protein